MKKDKEENIGAGISYEFETLKKILMQNTKKARTYEEMQIIFLSLIALTSGIHINKTIFNIPASDFFIPKERGEEPYIRSKGRRLPAWNVTYAILEKFFSLRDVNAKNIFQKTRGEKITEPKQIIDEVKKYTRRIVMEETDLGYYVLQYYNDSKRRTFSNLFDYVSRYDTNHLANGIKKFRKPEKIDIARLEKMKSTIKKRIIPNPKYIPWSYTCIKCGELGDLLARTATDFEAKLKSKKSTCTECLIKEKIKRAKNSEIKKGRIKKMEKELAEQKMKEEVERNRTKDQEEGEASEVKKEIRRFIRSQEGKRMGLKRSDEEEAVFLVELNLKTSKTTSIKDCVIQVFKGE